MFLQKACVSLSLNDNSIWNLLALIKFYWWKFYAVDHGYEAATQDFGRKY